MSIASESAFRVPEIRVAVIVPTWNRAPLLPRMLDALESQTLPQSEFIVVVVDNASTDGTAEVLTDASRRMPNLVALFEEEVGSSAARNRGVTETETDLLAFIDDDCIPTSTWLESSLACIEADPSVGAVVGRYRPPPEFRGPRWLHPALVSYDRGPSPEQVSKLKAGNMLIRRRALDKAGGFRTDLGMHGPRRGWGEETALASVLRSDGWTIRYCPESLVYHLVKPEKCRPVTLIRESFLRGRQEAMIEARPIGTGEALRAVAVSLMRKSGSDESPRSARLFLRCYSASRWIGAAVQSLGR